MGNKCVFEATIIKIVSMEDKYYVYVSPSRYDAPYYLNKKHPNVIHLYNKCKEGQTYQFITKHLYIEDLLPLKLHYITGMVTGFLDVNNEYKKITNYNQVMLSTTTPHRLLINKNENLIINNNYKFYYEKAFGDKFYLITKYEKIDY